jgi:hypothetical protein
VGGGAALDMRVPGYAKAGVVALAGAGVFLLPWPLTLVLIFFAGLVFPPVALLFGLLADALYYPGTGMLWGSAAGLILAVVSWVVRHFVKTRIM